jgi:hypothetical protein
MQFQEILLLRFPEYINSKCDFIVNIFSPHYELDICSYV